MNGIKFQIDKLIQQIDQLLIKPIEAPTRHLFDINYYSFTHQCMNITQILLERIQIGQDIRMYYQKLIKVMKQASKCRPEEEQSEMDNQHQILRTKDEIATLLNSRQPISQPKNRGQLYKFLAARQQKQKDNQTFLSNMNKVKVNQQLIQKSSKFEMKVQQIQTQIQWVHELKIKSNQHHFIQTNQYIKNLQKYLNNPNYRQSQKQKNERIDSSMKKDMQKQKKMKKIQKSVSIKKIVSLQKNDGELPLQAQGKMKSDQSKKVSTKGRKNPSKPQKILKKKQKIMKKQQIKQKQQQNQEIYATSKNKNQQIIAQNTNQQENLRKNIKQIRIIKLSQNQGNSQNIQQKQNLTTQQNLSINILNTEKNRIILVNKVNSQNISQKYSNQKALTKLQYNNQNQKISIQREAIQNQNKKNNQLLPILNKTQTKNKKLIHKKQNKRYRNISQIGHQKSSEDQISSSKKQPQSFKQKTKNEEPDRKYSASLIVHNQKGQALKIIIIILSLMQNLIFQFLIKNKYQKAKINYSLIIIYFFQQQGNLASKSL